MPDESDLPALRGRIESGLAELDLAADGRAADRLARFAILLHAWSRRINLTAHRSPADIVDRLLLDAVGLASVLPGFDRGCDLGSGAGIPGIPLALIWPDRDILLVEARERRHHFQRAAVRELEVLHARPLLGRADELEPQVADISIAQAMGPADQVLGWLRRWTRPGGWIAIPASPEQAIPDVPHGVDRLEARPYRVPLGGADRVVWLGRVES